MEFLKKFKPFAYILIIICVLGTIFINCVHNKKEKKIIIERKQIVDEDVPTRDIPTIDFKAMRIKYNNNDIVGAIRISNSKFEEVIFKSKDNNNYYLSHNYQGKESTKGEFTLDYQVNLDNSKIKIIYSNNKLSDYLNYDYYQEHNYLEIETEKLIYKYNIVSIFQDKIDLNLKNINQKYLNNLITKSKYKIKQTINMEDEILILCDFDSKSNVYIVGKRKK